MKKVEKKSEETESKSVNPSVGTAASTISEAEVQTCLDHLKAINDVLAPYAITLTKAARKSATRLRKGGDKVIPLMGRLAASAGMAGAALDAGAMQKQLDQANALLPLLTSAKTLTDTVGDTVLTANGKAWGAATTLHGVLKRVAKSKPEMRRDMEVVSAAFAIRKRSPAKAAEEASPGSGEAKTPTSLETPAPQPTTEVAPAAEATQQAKGA